MFSKRKLAWLLACAVVVTTTLSGCPSLFGQASFITVSPKTLDFGEKESVMKFRISFGGVGRALEWSLRVDTASADAWMSVSPTSGDGIHEVTVTVDRSKITKDEDATIVVTDENEGTTSVKVIVRKEKPAAAEGEGEDNNQEGEAAPTTPVLSVAPMSRNVSADEDSATFAVSNTGVGTMNWTAQVTEGDWLQIIGDSTGVNNGNITVNCSANSSPNPRTGNIQIIANGATGSPKTVSVVQAGFQGPITQPILEVTPIQRNVSAVAGTANFNISNAGVGTMNWTAAVTSGNWLHITSMPTGTNDGAITISYDANAAASARTGSISVTALGAVNSPATVSIQQAAASTQDELTGTWYSYFRVTEEDIEVTRIEFVGNTVKLMLSGFWFDNNQEPYLVCYEIAEGFFTSDPTLNPKQININYSDYYDWEIGEDESHRTIETGAYGIYYIDNDKLILSLDYDDDRPTSFFEEADEQFVALRDDQLGDIQYWDGYDEYYYLVSCTGTAPINDTCASAIPVYSNTPINGDNTCASTDRTDIPGSGDVWYRWTAGYSGHTSVSLCNYSSFDTRLAVLYGCYDETIAENDDYCDLGSKLFFQAQSGVTYYIRVSGYDRAEFGPFTLIVARDAGKKDINNEAVLIDEVNSAAAKPGRLRYTIPWSRFFKNQK